jgi:hypothetical protein
MISHHRHADLTHLQRVDEIRPVVTRNPDLVCSLASVHVVPLAAPSRCILALQHGPHEDCSTQQEQRHVCKHCAVASVVSWLLSLEENVGRDHTVDVAGADDDSNNNTALVDAFDVVTAPGKSVGNGRVDLEEFG